MRTAVIWGASGGIGSAQVRLLKQRGWRVFGVARDVDRIPSEVDFAFSFEAHSEHSFESAVMQMAQETTEIDLMLYSVGHVVYEKLDVMGLKGWSDTFQTNVTGAYLATSYTLNLMKDGGHFVYIGAYLDHLRLLKMGAYASAKAALQEMVTIFQKEQRKYKFTLVRPGAVNTAFWKQVALRLPADSKLPEAVAEAIWSHVEVGGSGDLNL